MTEPTAGEALDWLDEAELFSLTPTVRGITLTLYKGSRDKFYHGLTPLEAIRNAMKGGSDD